MTTTTAATIAETTDTMIGWIIIIIYLVNYVYYQNPMAASVDKSET